VALSGSATRYVIGLGNPGAEYRSSFHNLGFMVVDDLAELWRVHFRTGPGQFWWTRPTSGFNTVLVKPTTYMNQSGSAVHQIVEQSQVPLENLLLICDEIQLPFGKIRLRPHGSDGGHRGLESIIYHLASEEFARLRIGIGGGDKPEEWVEHVLSPISPQLEFQVKKIIETSTQAVECWIREGIFAAMNQFNALEIIDVESKKSKRNSDF
jgi:PTH1 family peptidyl-tRNA hydrolase